MDTNQVEGPDPRNDLSHFAREILAAKMQANAGLNGQSNPQRARVESSFSASPMTPARFEAPRGRIPTQSQQDTETPLVAAGSFFTIYVDSDSGDTKLQGGTVTGGSGTETIADIVIKSSGSSTMAQTAGTHMYIHASGSGVVEDGVLLPGWNQSTATVSYGTTVPSNDLPTASSDSGDVYVDLGVFTEDNFLPSKAGSINVAFCPGTFTITR